MTRILLGALFDLTRSNSTNEEARRRALAGDPGRMWIVADEQTAGRGRRGRAWISLRGNLHASALLDRSVPGADRAAARLRRRRRARARREGHRRGRGRPEVAERSHVQRREMRWNPRRKRSARRPGRRLCGRRRRQLRAGAGGPRLPRRHASRARTERRSARATCSSDSPRGSTRRSASGAPERRSSAFAPRGSIAPSVLADPS